MSKCRYLVCDLCGRHIEDDDGTVKLKIRKRWYAYPCDSGWERKKVHICPKCVFNLKYFLRKERKKEDD